MMRQLASIAQRAGALAALLLASGPPGPVLATEPTLTPRFASPFAYCAAVGTIDEPDARYTGPKVPKSIARGLQTAFGVPARAPFEPFVKNSVWRCVDGKVYGCTFGANLPCATKADTTRTPAQPLVDFCRENRDADVIPAYVTGRATVYEWRCAEAAPVIVRAVTQVDARGYLANIWHEIPRPRER